MHGRTGREFWKPLFNTPSDPGEVVDVFGYVRRFVFERAQPTSAQDRVNQHCDEALSHLAQIMTILGNRRRVMTESPQAELLEFHFRQLNRLIAELEELEG